jgi:hypothetical protein
MVFVHIKVLTLSSSSSSSCLSLLPPTMLHQLRSPHARTLILLPSVIGATPTPYGLRVCIVS